jgi:hypothetical protein
MILQMLYQVLSIVAFAHGMFISDEPVTWLLVAIYLEVSAVSAWQRREAA